jgi:hypothetical protein
MIRTLIAAAIGLVIGLLLVAAWGAEYGYREGLPGRRDLAPGWETAWISAFYCVVMLGWAGGGAGAVIGGFAGFASWLVRPRVKAAA